MGCYGAGSLGDDAILQGMLTLLGKENLTVVSFSPEKTSILFEVPTVMDSLFSTDYDSLILGGGGWVYVGHVLHYTPRIQKFLDLGKKVIVYGVGTDTLIGNEETVRDVFNKVDELSVRTTWDKSHLESIGITREIKVVEDPSLLIPTPPKNVVHSVLSKHFELDKPLMGLCISRKVFYTAKFIRMLQNLDYTFVPLVQCRHEFHAINLDTISLTALFTYLGLTHEVQKWMRILFTPSFMKGIIQSMDYVITTRKHPLMWARQKNIPVTVIASRHALALKEYSKAFKAEKILFWKDFVENEEIESSDI